MRNYGKKVVMFAVLVLGVFTLLRAGFTLEPSAQPGNSLKYGKAGTLNYSLGVTEEEVQRLADYLAKLEPSQGESPVFKLAKEGDVYQVSSVIDKEELEKQVPPELMGPVEAAGLLAEDVSQGVFNGSKVEWHLCDKDFNTLRVANY